MFSLLREVDGWKEEGRMTERRRNRKEEKKETWLHVCVVCVEQTWTVLNMFKNAEDAVV